MRTPGSNMSVSLEMSGWLDLSILFSWLIVFNVFSVLSVGSVRSVVFNVSAELILFLWLVC